MTAAHCEWSGEPVRSKRDGEKAAAAGDGADAMSVATQPLQSTVKLSSFSSISRMILNAVGSETTYNVNDICIDQALLPCHVVHLAPHSPVRQCSIIRVIL